MIGLDTNILVRYLTQDHAAQSRRATEVIEHQLTEEHPGFISLVAIVETVWVLDRVYGLSNLEIAVAIERILQADTLVVQNEQQAFTAMVALKTATPTRLTQVPIKSNCGEAQIIATEKVGLPADPRL